MAFDLAGSGYGAPGQARAALSRTTSASRNVRRSHRSSRIRSIGRAVSDHRDDRPGGPMTRRATGSRTDTSASRLQHGTTVLSRSPASESGVPSTRRARSPRRRPKMQVRAGSPRTHVWMSAGHPVRTAQRHPGDERPAGELEAQRAVRHLHLGRGRHRNALVAHALREPLDGGAGRAIRRERGEIIGGRPVERSRRARGADPDRQPLTGVNPHFHDGVGGE